MLPIFLEVPNFHFEGRARTSNFAFKLYQLYNIQMCSVPQELYYQSKPSTWILTMHDSQCNNSQSIIIKISKAKHLNIQYTWSLAQ